MVTTVRTPRRAAWSSTSPVYRRQRIDGSMPCTSSTVRPLTGAVATHTLVEGHVMVRRPSSPMLTCGRLTWKSWYSSGSSSATSSAPHARRRWSSAPLAASPASFQPSNAASITGSTSASGCSSCSD